MVFRFRRVTEWVIRESDVDTSDYYETTVLLILPTDPVVVGKKVIDLFSSEVVTYSTVK